MKKKTVGVVISVSKGYALVLENVPFDQIENVADSRLSKIERIGAADYPLIKVPVIL